MDNLTDDEKVDYLLDLMGNIGATDPQISTQAAMSHLVEFIVFVSKGNKEVALLGAEAVRNDLRTTLEEYYDNFNTTGAVH